MQADTKEMAACFAVSETQSNNNTIPLLGAPYSVGITIVPTRCRFNLAPSSSPFSSDRVCEGNGKDTGLCIPETVARTH